MEKLIRLDESDSISLLLRWRSLTQCIGAIQFFFDRDRCFLDREAIKHEGVFFINWFALELNPTRPLQILTQCSLH
ncbi:hypothetical protein NIES593_03115 [Hydrococcus rivularis NIES-593]|uniref:Uncharacterized protein n=1 Tax=Hydrococcus rivularis NIES-593 TaxID=1921803 RepID=A0A1U7HR86_9CYAN|nr:hypothetical protein [Hydrococcus rivularis]OKH26081.1 hypothetical protein NIES593_03115 [Hydrococcus rivularis NIES-593]